VPFGGACPNGVLPPLELRTHDNQCAKCRPQYNVVNISVGAAGTASFAIKGVYYVTDSSGKATRVQSDTMCCKYVRPLPQGPLQLLRTARGMGGNVVRACSIHERVARGTCTCRHAKMAAGACTEMAAERRC